MSWLIGVAIVAALLVIAKQLSTIADALVVLAFDDEEEE